jgi:hypothetical protein
MLEFLRGKVSDRKLLLFSCACFRRIWHWLASEDCRKAVDAAEASADSPTPGKEQRKIRDELTKAAGLAGYGYPRRIYPPHLGPEARIRYSPEGVARIAHRVTADASQQESVPEELRTQAHLIRDIIGNPYRSVSLDPAWRTLTVLQLGQSIYDDRAFDQLPILADALEDAGCQNASILQHLRSPGPHVRGCWALDLILGRN